MSEGSALPEGRTFAAPGKGGLGLHPGKTAVLFIEFQNEFASPGGKLHGSVRECMEHTGMLANAAALVGELRRMARERVSCGSPPAGGGLPDSDAASPPKGPPAFLFHAPISFSEDGGDNPNRYMGILGGCDSDKLFTRGTWGAQLCPALRPEDQTEEEWAAWGSESRAATASPSSPSSVDVLVRGKRGLSAFPGTDLVEQLLARGVETLALAGFMANCCVESTMREACERGFNVVSLTDCVATTSLAGYRACVSITYPFFSTPMTSGSFLAALRGAVGEEDFAAGQGGPAGGLCGTLCACGCSPVARPTYATRRWALEEIAADVFQAGPWFVDVRRGILAEKPVLRQGEHELRRYLVFAAAARGLPAEALQAAGGAEAEWDPIYARKLPEYGLDTDPTKTEPFGWLCNMTAVRLPGGGCLVYSPVLDAADSMDGVMEELHKHGLLPVRYAVAPSPQHHLALGPWQRAFPDAAFLCGAASGQMPPLTRKRRDLRFAGVLRANAGSAGTAGLGVALAAPAPDREGAGSIGGDAAGSEEARRAAMLEELSRVFELAVLDDNRSGEVVLLHRASGTLILSDALYKSTPEVLGPGGTTLSPGEAAAAGSGVEGSPRPQNAYTAPQWFAEGQEELFYGRPGDNSGGLLPAYRTHPRMRTIDLDGMRHSLDVVLGWPLSRAVCCHTDPIEGGDQVRALLRKAWGWLWSESD